MRNAYVDLDATKCTGCSACDHVCSTKCITMVADAQGFLIPQVDTDQCISCGLCRKICPALTPLTEKHAGWKIPHAYAAQSIDVQMRYDSTSGGVFSELAGWVIAQGGYVAGAIYDEQQRICHYLTNHKKDIERLRQSKYAQSDKGTVYAQVKQLTSEGKVVLFMGAPCETGGLLSYLGKRPESLLLVDFICLGVNSPLVYSKYLEFLENKYHSQIERVWFKYKKYGWEQFATRVDFKNKRTYVRDRYSDLFMRGYIQKTLYIRPCCYECPYKGFPRYSDLTLGDFWGVGEVFPDIDRIYGVSAICVSTTKGEMLLKGVKDRLQLCECKVGDVAAENRNLSHSVAQDERSRAFYDDLACLGFERAVKRGVRERWDTTLKRRIKCRMRTWKQRKKLTIDI